MNGAAIQLINDLAPSTRRDDWWHSDGPIEIINRALAEERERERLRAHIGEQCATCEKLRWAAEEIIQAADPGIPPWVLIPDHLIEQLRRALTGGE